MAEGDSLAKRHGKPQVDRAVAVRTGRCGDGDLASILNDRQPGTTRIPFAIAGSLHELHSGLARSRTMSIHHHD
jgi:hypothetical protein